MNGGLSQRARVMAQVEAHLAPWQSPAHSLACDAWSAVDRLAQLSPEEQTSVRGVILAIEHKINALKEARNER